MGAPSRPAGEDVSAGAQDLHPARPARPRRIVLFHQMRKGRLDREATLSAEHVEAYVERVRKDYTGLLRASTPIHVLTYEALVADPQTSTAGMLRFLGFEPEAATVEAMVNGASFQALANRTPGKKSRQPFPQRSSRRLARET